jgi:DNA-binding beta-propeller fold protein YncE
MALCLMALCVFSAHGTTLYWMEANFGAPRLVMADGSGAIKATLAIAVRSLPQGLAINPATNAVFWTELVFLNAHVKFARADLGDSGTVLSLQSCARGIVIDSTNKKIYWTATNLTAGPGIFRANLDGSSAEPIEFFGASSMHTPQGIAIDEKTQTLYWADFGAGAIDRASAAPLAPWQAIVTGLAGPVGMALDPDSGYVFWADANAGNIGRSGLDGSGASKIVINCLSPQYLSIDRTSHRLFWTEFGAGLVRSSRYDGTDTITLAHTTFPPCGIAAMAGVPVLSRAVHIPQVPERYAVFVNSSDPFGRTIRIRYQLPRTSFVTIEVFDLQSRRVDAVAVSRQAGGYYNRDVDASRLAPGAYCVRFTAGQFTSTTKYTIVR